MSPPASTSPAPRPAFGALRFAASALLAWAFGASPAHAAIVEFTQRTSPQGLFADVTNYVESAGIVSTQSAPDKLSSGNSVYAFVEWTLNGRRASDVYGQALNPATFTIYEPTIAVARYLPADQDADADGVPDWFEQRYFASLAQPASSDLDQDGLVLIDELARGTSPLLPDDFAAGGQSRRRAASLIAYQAPVTGSVTLSFATQPAGLVNLPSQSVQAWIETSLPTVPASTSGYHFSGWLVNGVRVDDPALPLPARVIVGVNSTAVARYTLDGADSDADGVPDWFELLYHDTLANPADFDGDDDGLGLRAESIRATSPRLVDFYTGGFSRRRAANTLGLNLVGYIRYSFLSDPAGLLSVSGTAAPGSVVASPDFAVTGVSGYAFTHWDVGGVRQLYPLSGGSATKLNLTITASVVATAHFILPSADADADGVPDWYELRHYGDLSQSPASDTDSDGLSLLAEFARDSSPRLRDDFTGGVSIRRQASLTVIDLQFFERLRHVLNSGVLADIFSPDPTRLTGQDFGANASPALGDWDGDGDLDLFIASAAGLYVCENIGTRHSLDLENRSAAFAGLGVGFTSSGAPKIALGDWNGDGRADLVVAGADGVLRFYVSSGSFSAPFTASPVFTLASGSASPAPALGDLNGDGRPDLLVLLADGSSRFYPNAGGATPFAAESAVDDYLGTPVGQGVGLAIGDINSDGRPDVVASDADGRLWEFHRTADGAGFSLRSKVWAGSGAGFAPRLAIALADLEGDGDTDAVGGTRDGALIGLRDPRVGRPGGLVATSGARSVPLSWEPDRQDRIKGYHVYRATTAAGPFERLTETALPLPAYVDTAVVAGQSYVYRVTGVTDAYLPGNSLPRSVESPPSDPASAIAGLLTFAVRPARAAAGNVVHVRIALANPFAISGAGLQLQLNYDPTILTPITQINSQQNTVAPSAISRDLVFSDNAASATGQLVISGSGGALNPGGGSLFVLTFRVAPGAPANTNAALTLAQVVAHDTDGHLLAWECPQNGPLTVSGGYADGDLTGDGVVDKADKTLLSELLKLGARPPTATELAAGDLNADGVLDHEDFVLLKRLINGRPIQ